MSLPRTEKDKKQPSFEHNRDKQKMRVPKVGDMWRDRGGRTFVITCLANDTQLEPYGNLFPLTVVFRAETDTRSSPSLWSRHLVAWNATMKFVRSAFQPHSCTCLLCEDSSCTCPCHTEE